MRERGGGYNEDNGGSGFGGPKTIKGLKSM